MNVILHIIGTDNPSGFWYLLWSGFGSVVLGTGIWANAYTHWKAYNCHVRWCFRHGRYQTSDYKVCLKHNPERDRHPSAQEVTHS